MKNNNFLTIFILSILVSLYSCNERNVLPEELPSESPADVANYEGISVKNGALHFDTPDLFFETTEKLSKMSQDERDKWGEQIGFISLGTQLNQIFNAISNFDDDVDLQDIVNENSDIVEFRDDMVVPIIQSYAYASTANRKGIFFVNGIVHKVDGGRIASSEDGNEETVTNALKAGIKSTTSSDETNNGIRVLDYVLQSSITRMSGCGNRMSAYNNSSDRKVELEMKTFTYYCSGCCGNYYNQVKFELIISNYKKNIWGNWKDYELYTLYKNVAATISAPIGTGYDYALNRTTFKYENLTFYYLDFDSGNNAYAKVTHWSLIGSQIQNSSIAAPTFSRVKGEASNKGSGMSGKWATIYCGAW